MDFQIGTCPDLSRKSPTADNDSRGGSTCSEILSNIDFGVFQANTEKYIDVVLRVYVRAHSESGHVPICPDFPDTNRDISGSENSKKIEKNDR